MTYFNWTSELDVKVDTMNQQHKVLISVMDDLFQINKGETNKQDIVRKLNELLSYTRKHFRDEELYMDAINFKDRERHKKTHQHLLNELEQRTEHFKNLCQTIDEEFFHFLRYWLTTHIKHIDKKYGIASRELELDCVGAEYI